MSRTMTIRNGSLGSRNRLASASRRGLFRMWGCQSSGSEAEPVITTLIAPIPSDALRCCRLAATRPQRRDLPVGPRDPPAHADDHGLAFVARLFEHGLGAVFEVLHEVPGDEPNPVLRTDNSLELRPLRLELLLALDLLALGHLLKLGVDPRRSDSFSSSLAGRLS